MSWCPECGRQAGSLTMRILHTPECVQGRAMAAMQENDRRWFASNPDKAECLRPVTDAERIEAWLHGKRVEAGATILVQQVRPGVRVRLVMGAAA